MTSFARISVTANPFCHNAIYAAADSYSLTLNIFFILNFKTKQKQLFLQNKKTKMRKTPFLYTLTIFKENICLFCLGKKEEIKIKSNKENLVHFTIYNRYILQKSTPHLNTI